jgi:hypothetical protein
MKPLLLCLLVACGSPQPPAAQTNDPTPTPAPTQTPTQTTEQPATALPSLGDPCGANDACGSGLECISYYGIAGPRGPQFKTCEIRCKVAEDCPSGNRCATIADGPGQVCRPNT